MKKTIRAVWDCIECGSTIEHEGPDSRPSYYDPFKRTFDELAWEFYSKSEWYTDGFGHYYCPDCQE